MEQALAFYGHLGFATTYHGEGFAIVERDRIALHFNVSEGHSVAWISVTNIEAVYQHYLPTGAIQSPPPPFQATPWRAKEFWPCDPFRTTLIFGEEASTELEG